MPADEDGAVGFLDEQFGDNGTAIATPLPIDRFRSRPSRRYTHPAVRRAADTAALRRGRFLVPFSCSPNLLRARR